MARAFKTGITADGDIATGGVLKSTASAGDEGGQIDLTKSVTNTTLTTVVSIDVYQNRLRFFETGGTNRGYYIDISAGGSSVGTNLVGGGSGFTGAGTSITNITGAASNAMTITSAASGNGNLNLYAAGTGNVNIGSTSGSGGGSGTISIQPTTTSGATGGSLLLYAGASSNAAGVGGDVNVAGGAGTSGSTGGAVSIRGGSGNGSGDGNVYIGTSNTAAVALGNGSNVYLGSNATLQASPITGQLEYDTDKFYGTPNGNNSRGFIPAIHMVFANANSSATTSTTSVSPFAAANDVLSGLDAAKLYYFKGSYYLTSTFTSGTATVNMGFTFSNAPTKISYKFTTYPQTPGTTISRIGVVSSALTTAVTPAITATISYVVDFEGFFYTNATTGGTIAPFIAMSTTGSSTVATEFSYIQIQKIGSTGTAKIAGAWA